MNPCTAAGRQAGIAPRTASPGLPERGSMLAVVSVALLPVIGLISIFFSRSVNEMHAHMARRHADMAVQRSLAAMEIARNIITNSNYDDPAYANKNARIWEALSRNDVDHLRPSPDGNLFMFFNRDTGRREYRTYGEVLAPGGNYSAYRLLTEVDLVDDLTGEADDASEKVRVYVVQLTDLWHMLEAEATVRGVTRTSRVVVRERDPFTRFSVLIGSHYQGISGTPKGDIHTNEKLQIFFPDGHFDDFVSAYQGFEWFIGADWSNTDFAGGYDETTAAPIVLPDLNEVQARMRPPVADLSSWERGSDYLYVGTDYENIQITFNDEDVVVTAEHVTNPGVPVPIYNGSLRDMSRIYVTGAITSIEGDLNGRLSVATESSQGVNITGSLRYVDGDGDPAMLNPNDPNNYGPNPDYDGNSALGIIAPEGPVLYDHGIPDTFEMHAAVYAGDSVGLPGLGFTGPDAPYPYNHPSFGPGQYVYTYDPSFQKQNLNMLGLTIADHRWVGSVVDGNGNVLSGFQDGSINYDRSLLNNPPPFFLDLERPLFKAVEILENSVDI